MGTREAAEHLGVTLRTLYSFIDQGDLPAYRMGGVIRLRSEDVTSFVPDRSDPTGLEHLYPDGDDPNPGLGGVREPRRPRPPRSPEAEHLRLPEAKG